VRDQLAHLARQQLDHLVGQEALRGREMMLDGARIGREAIERQEQDQGREGRDQAVERQAAGDQGQVVVGDPRAQPLQPGGQLVPEAQKARRPKKPRVCGSGP
jgi:hypothetical protein